MITLNEFQKAIFEKKKNNTHLSLLIEVCEGSIEFNSLNEDEQLEVLEITNACYRAQMQIIEDSVFDGFEEIFKQKNTLGKEHPFLTHVQPEEIVEGKTVLLPKRMMSTQKAYTKKEINKWLENIKTSAQTVGVTEQDIIIRVTPKLDGFAAYDDGDKLYTRGDGTKGRDISYVFDRGLQVGGGNERGLEQGEIVISKTYFAEHLSEHFENSRNIQASIIAEKNIDPRVQIAISDGAAVFYPFSKLESWESNIDALLEDFEYITKKVLASCDYDVDGVILECKNDEIKNQMGATRKHHRWQIALKSNDEKAEVKVLEVIPQTSRNGKLTPVLRLEPTRLSGAEISRVTAHHYGMVRDRGIGKGAVIELVRSGLVIPKIERIIESAESDIPEFCPCCDSKLEWIDDSLFCLNSSSCKDQIEKSIIYFFDILGNIDGFGAATISVLNENGVSSIYDTYLLENDADKLTEMGYKDKTVSNLMTALANSRAIQIEDWRFLAAFGVNRLGLGIAENLLQHHAIETIFELKPDDLVKIDGFAEKSAQQIVEGLSLIKDQFNDIFSLSFNLAITPNINESRDSSSPIAGKVVVFTGSMQSGSRGDMEKNAKLLGAKVAKSVSGKTDYLVTGDKVGAKKITDAQDKGVTVISEMQYLELVSN